MYSRESYPAANFIDFLLNCRIIDENVEGFDKEISVVWRRYSEFETLHDYLGIIYPFVVIPPIPEKRVGL